MLSQDTFFLKISLKFVKSFRRYEDFLHQYYLFSSFFFFFDISLLQKHQWRYNMIFDVSIFTFSLISIGWFTTVWSYIVVGFFLLEIWRRGWVKLTTSQEKYIFKKPSLGQGLDCDILTWLTVTLTWASWLSGLVSCIACKEFKPSRVR